MLTIESACRERESVRKPLALVGSFCVSVEVFLLFELGAAARDWASVSKGGDKCAQHDDVEGAGG